MVFEIFFELLGYLILSVYLQMIRYYIEAYLALLSHPLYQIQTVTK